MAKMEKLIEWYKKYSDEEFLNEYSIWYKENGKSIINEFVEIINSPDKYQDINGKDDFSWTKLISTDQNSEEIKKAPKNVHYGIPCQVVGDWSNSLIYHCLLNSGTTVSDKNNNYKNVVDYYQKNKHSTDPSLNLYSTIICKERSKEISDTDVKNFIINKKNKISEELDNYISFLKNIIEKGEEINILDIMIPYAKSYTNDKLTEVQKASYITFLENIQNEYKIFIFDSNQSQNKIINNLKNELSQFSPQNKLSEKINEECNLKFINKEIFKNYCYYISSYYSSLGLIDEIDNLEDLIENLKSKVINNPEYKNEVKYNLCNLELNLFRSENKDGIKDIDVSKDKDLLTAYIILRRIVKFEADELNNDKNAVAKPIFIFRSSKKWTENLKTALKVACEQKKMTKDLNEIFEYIVNKYFYKHNGQNGTISMNNITKIRISKKEFDEIKINLK